jgi:PTS system nitrogen regulatory IIA component
VNIQSDHIVLDLVAGSFEKAIEPLIQKLPPQLDHAEVRSGVLEREQLGATDMGCGVAIPHFRIAGLETPLLFACRLKNTLSGSTVRLLMLLLTDKDRPSQHLASLASAARQLQDKKHVEELLLVETTSEFADLWNNWTE